jgi:TM2 domain-containing membrane protein YozV
MNTNLCPQCGAPIDASASKCEYCGASISQPAQQPQVQQPQKEKIVYVQQPTTSEITERSNWPIKNKIVAAILAIVLGGLGIHKFYLGHTGKGILYLLFCWTYIPSLIAFIEGIIILCSNDENFQIKYKCRLG